MVRIDFLLCIVFLFLQIAAWAQDDKIESRRWADTTLSAKERFESFDAYKNENILSSPKRILNSGEESYQLAKKLGNTQQMIFGLEDLAQALSLIGNKKQAIIKQKKALDLAISVNDPLFIASRKSNLGVMYYYINDYKNALKFMSESCAVYEQNNDYIAAATIQNNLGLLFYDIKDFDLSLEYYKRAIEFYKKAGADDSRGFLFLNIAASYLKKGELKRAKSNVDRAKKLLIGENNVVKMTEVFYILRQIYEKQQKYDLALQNARIELQYHIQLGDSSKIMVSKSAIGNILITLDSVSKAESIVEEITTKLDLDLDLDFSQKSSLYEFLHRYHKLQNESNLALYYLEQYTVAQDSLSRENSNFTLIREAISNDYDVQLTKTRTKSAATLIALRHKQSRREFIIWAGAISAFLLLLSVFFSRAWNNRKSKEALIAEIEKLKHESHQDSEQSTPYFTLDREKIEQRIERNLNETDWTVLTILIDDPVISNKDLAAKAYLSVDGIGSSLRRMYDYFEVKESKYKKISLLFEAVKISNK